MIRVTVHSHGFSSMEYDFTPSMLAGFQYALVSSLGGANSGLRIQPMLQELPGNLRYIVSEEFVSGMLIHDSHAFVRNPENGIRIFNVPMSILTNFPLMALPDELLDKLLNYNPNRWYLVNRRCYNICVERRPLHHSLTDDTKVNVMLNYMKLYRNDKSEARFRALRKGINTQILALQRIIPCITDRDEDVAKLVLEKLLLGTGLLSYYYKAGKSSFLRRELMYTDEVYFHAMIELHNQVFDLELYKARFYTFNTATLVRRLPSIDRDDILVITEDIIRCDGMLVGPTVNPVTGTCGGCGGIIGVDLVEYLNGVLSIPNPGVREYATNWLIDNLSLLLNSKVLRPEDILSKLHRLISCGISIERLEFLIAFFLSLESIGNNQLVHLFISVVNRVIYNVNDIPMEHTVSLLRTLVNHCAYSPDEASISEMKSRMSILRQQLPYLPLLAELKSS